MMSILSLKCLGGNKQVLRLSLARKAATLINGKAIASQIKNEVKEEIQELVKSYGCSPGLAVILVGSRKDSQSYVRSKKASCIEVGIASFGVDFPVSVTESELLQKIRELNEDARVHGILVQLPLPPHISEKTVIEHISKAKDVDGLHPVNMAELTHSDTRGAVKLDFDFAQVNYHVACTPQGCIELLDRSGVNIEGQTAVVIGRSNIVGMPVALLLIKRHATVTVVHSRTKALPEVVKQADIVIAAIGRAEYVQGSWLKPGATVIDVGINHVIDAAAPKGYRVVGDCDFVSCSQVAGKITPVPGGVGPMTIAMLLKNTVNSFRRLVKRLP